MKTGELFVEEGLVSPEDIDRVLAIQKNAQTGLGRDRFLGMILCDLNLVTPTDNYCVLDKHGKLVTVQQFLVQEKIISRSVLDKAIAESREKDIPFISLLVDQEILTKDKVHDLLFELFHIPFRSISDIVFGENTREVLSSVVNKERARENRIIPLAAKGQTLLVGITDPANLPFLGKLALQFPQYRFKPLFIPFSGFVWFYNMLYQENFSPSVPSETGAENSFLPLFSVTIDNPGVQTDEVLSLYRQYELSRKQILGRDVNGRDRMFEVFLEEQHAMICRKHNCRSVAYCLDTSKDIPGITAYPCMEED